MKHSKPLAAAVLFSAALCLATADEALSFSGWRQAQTEHFNFIFEEESREAAVNYALIADDAWNKVSKFYSIPKDNTNVFVTARTDTVNAYTYFAPSEIMMFTTPVITPDFGFRENWQKLFFTHELVHLANATFEDKSTFAEDFFGGFTKNMDFGSVPGWAMEGLATLMETEITAGGRGRSPYFELNYKAPILENSFISYNEIGQEAEPPIGQAYVMGYLILRNIADRFGLEAMADIERNRDFITDWESSIKLVTGQYPSDIYRDVKIALTKKYAAERFIPEGITVTPRNTSSYYYKPAVILDNGSFVTLRSVPGEYSAIVLFNPANTQDNSSFIEDVKNDQLETQFTETILFEGQFADSTAYTSSKNLEVYASMPVTRADRRPGSECQYPLFKWTQENGLVQLTNCGTLFQPSVSEDGTTLVAVQQKGMDMSLVLVDTVTGEVTTLLSEKNISFIEPSVNADGTAVTFLVIDGVRAKVAVMNIAEGTYTYVANAEGIITDPAYPSWNSNGNITYTSNNRGRLEVYEATFNGQSYESKPVVSDPVAALWAYKTDKAVYYWSYASSGNVLKVKPAEEWGNVPDFNGPSMPGEIVGFKDLQADFAGFNPYGIEPEEYEKRSAEKTEFAANLTFTQTTLQNEKRYVPYLYNMMNMPSLSFEEDADGLHLGYGWVYIGMLPKLQQNVGLVITTAFYIPAYKNFTLNAIAMIPAGSDTVSLYAGHTMTYSETAPVAYTEKSIASLTYSASLLNRQQGLRKSQKISGDLTLAAGFIRESNSVIAINSAVPGYFDLNAQAALNTSFMIPDTRNTLKQITSSAIAAVNWKSDTSRVSYGAEGSASYAFGELDSLYRVKLTGRYTDFEDTATPLFSNMFFAGEDVNCLYPVRLLGEMAYTSPMDPMEVKVYAQSLVSFGSNSFGTTPASGLPLNTTLDSRLALGLEGGISGGLEKIFGGYCICYDISKKDFTDGKFYFKFSLGY